MTEEHIPPAMQLIEEEEGKVPHAYQDSRGFWTIGVGHLIDHRVGGKLDDYCINVILQQDVQVASNGAKNILGDSWDSLNPVRQAVLTSMVFQMGAKEMDSWHLFLDAVGKGSFKLAATYGRQTAWAKETPERADRQMTMLETGQWVDK